MPRKAKKQTRRGNGEGSIFQRKDGKWVGEVTLGCKPDGKRDYRTFYGKTREEVARKVTAAANDAFSGVKPVEKTKVTLEPFIMEWLMNYKRVEVSPRTLEFYLNVSRAYIFPNLGHIRLQDLTADQIQGVITGMTLKQDKSFRTVKAFRDTLRQALNHAVDMNLISFNPTVKTKLQKNDGDPDKDAEKAISVELRAQILKAAENDAIMRPIVTTLMFTGLRSAELLALRWQDVDLASGIITVNSAVSISPDSDDFGAHTERQTVVCPPKTQAGHRKIQAPPMVLDVIHDWKAYIERKIPSHSEFVFCSTKTEQLRTYNAFRTSFRHFLARNGLGDSGITLHSFRHTAATIMLENGISPRVVQRILGHADIQTTLGTYSHVMQEVYGDVAAALGDVYTDMIAGTYAPGAYRRSTVNEPVKGGIKGYKAALAAAW